MQKRQILILLLAFLFPTHQIASQPIPSSPASGPRGVTQNRPPCVDNGTYVNRQGKTVKRPENCSSTPQGASAQCRDGSF